MYLDGTYLSANPSWHAEDSAWKARHVVEMLRRHRISPAVVCEVGCGAGEILASLRRAFPQSTLIGYDISPDAILLANARATEGLSFRLADVLCEDVHYDVLLAADVFEHVDDYLGFLRRLRSKADWLVFHIPLDFSALNVVRRAYIMRTREQLGHLHHFTADTALSTLRMAGYSIVEVAYTSGAVELSARRGRRRLVDVVRRVGRAFSPGLTARVLGGFSLLVLTRPERDEA